MTQLLSLAIRNEVDIVNSRKRVRQIASKLGLQMLEQTQLATAVSEAARNAVKYGGGGFARFILSNREPFFLRVDIEDKGPGISNLAEAIASTSGLGLKACHRLVDTCEITSTPEGTTVTLVKNLALTQALSRSEINSIIDSLLALRPSDAAEEVKLQNRELILSLEELRKQQDIADTYQKRLEDLNKELADTNRGVIALNSELEDQAKTVREASDVKGRFLSHVTHEFRTPVNSMLSMSRILLSESTNLNDEERKQLGFIRKAAEGLSEMVNDLLDNVKVDAKKVGVTLAPTRMADVFDTLRAMFRPLMEGMHSVRLEFELQAEFPNFISDETKISQILRNFISNSLKFTEKGQISVRATIHGDSICVEVEDTGIGIDAENHEKIFEEFFQVQGLHQKRVKGTGLGLSLTRKFAKLLGGEVSVSSVPSQGATFRLNLPFQAVAPQAEGSAYRKILMIDDDEASHMNLRNLLQNHPFEFAFALDGNDGLRLSKSFHPDAIILDLRMPGIDGFEVLRCLKEDADTQPIPVLLNSSLRMTLDDFAEQAYKPDFILQKDDLAEGRGLEPIIAILNRRRVYDSERA